jgi:3-oxoacyl-[acyl-carrier protein] reductase
MSDLLLQLSSIPNARRMIKRLGLPLPLPQPLERSGDRWEERPLEDAPVVVGAAADSELLGLLARTLIRAGANPYTLDEATAAPFRGPGEAWGRSPVVLPAGELPARLSPRALVFDATGIRAPGELRALHSFFHPLVGAVARSGRVLVLGRAPESVDGAAAASASAALDGFVRSLAKELGGKGATAHLVYVEPKAEPRLEPVVRWLLSRRSAFVTGQPIRVTRAVRAGDEFPTARALEGKVALVTGAARGIGATTAEQLAAEGAHVVCLDRPDDDEPTSVVARRIQGSVLLEDVSDPAAAKRIAVALQSRLGGVDVVVHNAGVTRDKTLARMKPELWNQAVDINLAAVVHITEALLEGALRDDGRIVCLSSVAGIAGNMGQTNYAASKAGLIGFVRRLAPALAPRGIAVNAVAPGFIETRLTAAMPVAIREVARRLSALSQGGLPEDVGAAITFLASPGAAGITGSVLRVCGGSFVGA